MTLSARLRTLLLVPVFISVCPTDVKPQTKKPKANELSSRPSAAGAVKKSGKSRSKSSEAVTGTVFFIGPEGTTIVIDGEIVGQVPSRFELRAGFHRIRVKKDGYADWIGDIDLRAGSSVTLKPEFKDPPYVPH